MTDAVSQAVSQAVRKAVFLDRDGVLNLSVVREGKPYPPAAPDQLQIYSDTASALARLKQAGYLLIVVTNQPDVAHGTQTRAGVIAINAALTAAIAAAIGVEMRGAVGAKMRAKMGATLLIDEFRVCWHDDRDDCDCRKPKPGLVLAAAASHGIDLTQSFLIGDRWRDIDCGAAAGVRTVLIDRHYQERPPASPPTHVVDSLGAAATWILRVSKTA